MSGGFPWMWHPGDFDWLRQIYAIAHLSPDPDRRAMAMRVLVRCREADAS